MLNEWDSFYVIVGSAAGALIGLQFVVMTLIAERPPLRAAEGAAAFGTPTVVHFSAVLLLSALLRAPWQTMTSPASLWGILGFIGSIYEIIVIRRMFTQTVYKPILEDWLFHAVLPLLAYILLALSALAVLTYMQEYEREALFGAGATALLLLFIGIHNSWDAIAYHVTVSRNKDGKAEQDSISRKG